MATTPPYKKRPVSLVGYSIGKDTVVPISPVSSRDSIKFEEIELQSPKGDKFKQSYNTFKTTPPRKKKFKLRIFRRLHYEKTNTFITFFSFLGSFVLVVSGILKQILYPNVDYCTSIHCTNNQMPRNLDFPLFITVVSLGAFFGLLATSIIFCPGALMWYPKRNKIISFISLFFIICSIILFLSPVLSRKRVVPYNFVQNYTATVTNNGTSVVLSMNNVYSSYYKDVDKVFVRVYKTRENASIKDINPFINNFVIYDDLKNSEFTKMTNTTEIIREYPSLKEGVTYMFVAYPSIEKDGTLIYKRSFNHIKFGNSTIDSGYIDLRIYYMCKWVENSCIS